MAYIVNLKDNSQTTIYPQTQGDAIVDFAATILKVAYPVGSLYISTDSTSPASFLGGSWSQITTDAYLKIVTSSAGSAGGTASSHKIPTSSMPSHTHTFYCRVKDGSASIGKDYGPSASGDHFCGQINNYVSYNQPFGAYNTNTGGGNAYYPYYYGVYVWKRTA